VSAVVGVPGDANVYYIGALAIDPTNPNVVWAGTGEAHIRSNVSSGPEPDA